MKNDYFWKTWLPLAGGVLFLGFYFFALRGFVPAATASLIEFIALAGCVLAVLVGLLVVIVSLASQVVARHRPSGTAKLGNRMVFLLTIVTLLVLFVAASQWTASTPAILGAGGTPLPGGSVS